MKSLSKLLFTTLIVLSIYPLKSQDDFEYTKGFAHWEGRKLSWDVIKYGFADSLKVVAIDTSGSLYKIIRRVVYDDRSVLESEQWYVPDGIYYLRGYLFFPDNNVATDISMSEYRQLKLDTPEHGEYGVSLNPVFSWNQLFDAQTYNIQIAKDSLFTDLLVDKLVNDTTYHLEDEPHLIAGLERMWYDELEFDGTQEALIKDGWYYDLPQYTISVWIKPDADGQDYVSVIAGVDDSQAPGFQKYGLGLNSENKIRWRVRPKDNATTSYSSFVAPLNEWTHLLGTYDGSVKHLYINGELEIERSINVAMEYHTDDVFVIGASSLLPNGRRYSGLLTNLGIWDRVLSENERMDIFNAGYDHFPLPEQTLDLDTRYYWRVRPYDEENDIYGQWSGK